MPSIKESLEALRFALSAFRWRPFSHLTDAEIPSSYGPISE